MAREILLESESELKWKQLGDAALHDTFDLRLAEECYWRAGDLGGLLLIYSSTGDRKVCGCVWHWVCLLFVMCSSFIVRLLVM